MGWKARKNLVLLFDSVLDHNFLADGAVRAEGILAAAAVLLSRQEQYGASFE